MPNKKLLTIIGYGVGFNTLGMLVGAISAIYMFHWGLSVSELGFLKAYQFVLILLLDIPLSYIADNYSRKFSILMAGFFSSLWLLFMALADSSWWFYVAETFNALSLVLFNGAFVAYLIDSKNSINPQMPTQSILALSNKYDFLLMAIASVIGALFIKTSSSFIWYLSSGLLFLWTMIFIFILPKDTNNHQTHSDKPLLLQIKDDGSLVLNHLRHHALSIFMMVILMAVYMQILIQLWQPILLEQLNGTNITDDGWVYGLALGFIFLVQSIASKWVVLLKKYHKILFCLLIVLPLPLVYTPLLFDVDKVRFVVSVAGLSILFLLARGLLIGVNALFHDSLQEGNERLRASFEASSSVAAKLVLVAVFPLATWLLDDWGLWALMLVFVILGCGLFIGLRQLRHLW